MMSAEIGPIPDTEFTKPKSKFIKMTSIRSSKSKGGEEERKKQIQDYVVWVNSYLKNRPGTPQITDLKAGMQDGITLVNLVEAAANSQIPFVNRRPTSLSTRKLNVEKAIAFLKSDGANVTGDPVKDIFEGNMKGIMKVVLVVAEKYNPRSVRPIVSQKLSTSTTSSSSSQHPTSHTASSSHTTQPIPVTQGKSPERIKDSSTSPRGTSPVPQSHPIPQSHLIPQSHPLPFNQSRSYQNEPHFQSYHHPKPSQTTHNPSQQPHLQAQHNYNGGVPSHSQGFALSQGYALSQGFGGMSQNVGISGEMTGGEGMIGGGYSLSQPVAQSEDIYSDPIDSLPKNVTQKISSGGRVSSGQRLPRSAHNRLSLSNKLNPLPHSNIPNIPEDTIVVKETAAPVIDCKQEATQTPPDNSLAFGEINGALSGLGELKIELLKLHTVLLDNVGGGEVNQSSVDMKLPLEVANSEIMTKDKEIVDLQDELDKMKEALAKSDSECETLKEMVMERNQFITGMKTEIYRKEYRNDTEKVDLQTQLIHKDKKIKMLEGEINLMKASVEGKEREVVDMRKKRAELESREQEIHDELTSVKSELTRAIEAEENLQAKLFSRDRKISHLEEKLEVEKGILQRIDPAVVSEEMDGIREMLVGLRESMEANNHNQQTLDSLEKSISGMITKFADHVRSLSPNRRPRRHHDDRREERKKRHHRDRGESRASREEVLDRSHYSSSASASTSPAEWTKVFYYITGDKMETPYVTSVPRKATEVRLKDFKAVFDRHGSYRFYFKTEDPDCGVVREEIINDDHILPAWNGKIMVWVTEKAHHR